MYRPKAASGAAIILVLLIGAPALGKTEHCPAGVFKIEATVEGDLDDVVFIAPTAFCVKGGQDTSGIVIADSTTSLVAFLNNGHSVSYVVVYPPEPQPTPTP
jgi:hypothetical protein